MAAALVAVRLMLIVGTAPDLVAGALARGIPVTVLARRKAQYPPGVRVVTGDVKFPAALVEALEGESVVVSVLRGAAPVARLSLQALIDGMHAAGVPRLVAVSGPLDDAVRASRLDFALVSTPLAALDTLEP